MAASRLGRVALPRTSWRRRPLLALLILILLLVIGYAARGLRGDDSRSSLGPNYSPGHSYSAGHGYSASHSYSAQDGARLAAKAAIPSCACGLAK